MSKKLSLSLLICLIWIFLFSMPVSAEAPIVDNSENFAILNDEGAFEEPLRHANVDSEEEIALAKESGESDSNLSSKLQKIQQEVQELRGQLEMLTQNLKLLQQQQFAFYKDVDNRLRQNTTSTDTSSSPLSKQENTMTYPSSLSQAQSPDKTAQTNMPSLPLNKESRPFIPFGTTHLNPAEEQISYLAAYDLVKNKHFDEALSAMQTFVKQYPQGGYTANAQYWLGELFLVKNDYPHAIAHFEVVLKNFPSSSKTAASTLKIGYALAAAGKIEESKTYFHEVLQNYPDTPTAQLAKMKLKSLGLA